MLFGAPPRAGWKLTDTLTCSVLPEAMAARAGRFGLMRSLIIEAPVAAVVAVPYTAGGGALHLRRVRLQAALAIPALAMYPARVLAVAVNVPASGAFSQRLIDPLLATTARARAKLLFGGAGGAGCDGGGDGGGLSMCSVTEATLGAKSPNPKPPSKKQKLAWTA